MFKSQTSALQMSRQLQRSSYRMLTQALSYQRSHTYGCLETAAQFSGCSTCAQHGSWHREVSLLLSARPAPLAGAVQAVLLTHLLRIVIRRSLLHCHIGEMNIWHEIEIRIKAKQTLSK